MTQISQIEHFVILKTFANLWIPIAIGKSVSFFQIGCYKFLITNSLLLFNSCCSSSQESSGIHFTIWTVSP
jgi:hypothetical protein